MLTIPVEKYERHIQCLKEFGLNNYDAKIYLAISILRVASPSVLNAVTDVPRTKIYPSLNMLTEQEYIIKYDDKPSKYVINEKFTPFNKKLINTGLLVEETKKLFTEILLQNTKEQFIDKIIYEPWAIESQFIIMCQNAVSEIVIIVSEGELLQKYESILVEAKERGVDVNVIIKSHDMIGSPKLTYLEPNPNLRNFVFNNPEISNRGVRPELLVYTDRVNSYNITIHLDGHEHGLISYRNVYASYMVPKILGDCTVIR